ncbi:MAG TPA: alpha/beta fold hydrolase [Thermoanaerobaculia bacterium]|nr:alpha/beta fold hydrolase [Thermoanaerobaculia bacterium]
MKFTVESSEGLPIRGDLHLPEDARALVVIAHGFKGFKDWAFFPWLAEHLAGHRLAVCRFNMSRSGIGESPESFDRLDLFADDTYSEQIADLVSATAYAQGRSDLPTFLLGHSRGGGIALLTADLIPNLAGVITWSAIARADRWDDATKKRWRADGFLDVVNQRTKQVMRMSTAILDDYEANRDKLDILGAASRLHVPLLVVHGGRDESVPVEESAAIAAAAPEVSRLILHSAGHTYNAIHPLIHIPAQLTCAAEVTAHFVMGSVLSFSLFSPTSRASRKGKRKD